MQDFVRLSGIGFAFRIVTILLLCFHIVRGSWAIPVAGVSPAISSLACQAVALAKAGHPPLITSGKLLPSYFFETRSPSGLLAPTLVTNASPARTLLCRASRALHCISAAPAALDRYLAALPAMSLIPFAPLYLGCARSARPLPRGFTGHVAHPIRSILLPSSFLLLTFPAAVGSFTFEVIGGSLRAPSSRRRSKSSEIFA